MEKILIYTEEDSEQAINLSERDSKLNEAIKAKYDFEVGYAPGGYDVAFLLIEEDSKDSSKDSWKTVFYKKRRKLSGTITLDNMDELDNTTASYEYDFFKEIDGNFEDVIDFAADLIKNKITREGDAPTELSEEEA